MQLFRPLLTRSFISSHTPPSAGGVVAMGNMDGVHLGHRAIIALVKNLALPQGLLTHVVSFDPHPRDYFAALGRGAPVQHIQSVRDRKIGRAHV